jgi:hypothetical protein
MHHRKSFNCLPEQMNLSFWFRLRFLHLDWF